MRSRWCFCSSRGRRAQARRLPAALILLAQAALPALPRRKSSGSGLSSSFLGQLQLPLCVPQPWPLTQTFLPTTQSLQPSSSQMIRFAFPRSMLQAPSFPRAQHPRSSSRPPLLQYPSLRCKHACTHSQPLAPPIPSSPWEACRAVLGPQDFIDQSHPQSGGLFWVLLGAGEKAGCGVGPPRFGW